MGDRTANFEGWCADPGRWAMSRWNINIERVVTYSGVWVVEAPASFTEAQVREIVRALAEGADDDAISDCPDADTHIGRPTTAGHDDKPTHHLGEDGQPYTPLPPVWAEPTDGQWFECDGHLWATDGHIAIRQDGPRPSPDYRPNRYGDPATWLTSVGADGLRPLLAKGAPLQPHGPGRAYAGVVTFVLADESGKPRVGVQGWFRPLLDAPDLRVVASASSHPGAVVALRGGQPVALVACLPDDTWRAP